jgi:ABC-2 type transport system permease protein
VGSQLFFVVGLWLGITTLSFHSAAAARTRQRLAEHGRAGWVGSLPTLLVVAGVGGALWWAFRQAGPLPPFEPKREWVDASLHVLEEPPLSWVLWPLSAFARVLFAVDLQAFAVALPQALLVLALHYLWVISGDVSFEESSVLAAEKRAQALEARRGGNTAQLLTPAEKRRVPFKLEPSGPPEVALVWKGLIASGRLFNVRVLAIFGLMFVPMAIFAGLMKSLQFATTMLGFLMLSFWAMGTLLGGSMSRSDLRRDIEFIDVLRALPMSGRQIVLGEALGALVPALVVQWGLLAGGLVLMQGDDLFFELDLHERIVWGLALGIAGPAVTLAGILVQNAAVIFVPAWVANPKDGPRGPEASGVAMLVLLGTLLGVSLGLLPAAIFGLLVGFALLPLLGLWSLVAGAVALSGVAAFEAWVAAAILGKAFETVEPGA